MSNIKDLLVVTDEDIAEARKKFQKSESDLKQDVAILKEWLRQQPHLPDDEDEGRLERMFLRNKCRLEETKKKLERCYSFKVIYPDTLEMYDINSASIQNAINSMIFVPLPGLTEKQERIFCFKVTNPDAFRGHDCILYICLMIELCNTYDYSLADLYIVDWDDFSFSAMKTLKPSTMQKFADISLESLSTRIASQQYVNVPTFIDIFLQMLKSCAPKLYSKINCNTIEGIAELVPKKMLPIEFGGQGKSIYKLHEEWSKELSFQADLLTKLSKRISNESLRIGKLEENDLFGKDGSFKKITVE